MNGHFLSSLVFCFGASQGFRLCFSKVALGLDPATPVYLWVSVCSYSPMSRFLQIFLCVDSSFLSQREAELDFKPCNQSSVHELSSCQGSICLTFIRFPGVNGETLHCFSLPSNRKPQVGTRNWKTQHTVSLAAKCAIPVSSQCVTLYTASPTPRFLVSSQSFCLVITEGIRRVALNFPATLSLLFHLTLSLKTKGWV